jgi:glycosyltransferase involved in cell wall biosynthesis
MLDVRVLVVADDPPWPTNSGGRLVVSRELTALRNAGHTVDFVYYQHRGDSDGAAQALRSTSTVASIDRLSLVRATARRPWLPYQMSSRSGRPAELPAGIDGPYDVIICHHEWVVPLGTAIRSRQAAQGHVARLVLRSHNDEVAYYRALLEGRLSFAKRVYLTLERLRTTPGLIRRTAGRADEIWLISPHDETAYADLDAVRRLVLPILVEDETELALPPDVERPYNLLFVGALDPAHAVHGLEWFLDEVWPAVVEHLPATQFVVAGRRASEALRRKLAATPGVRYLGEVESLGAVLDEGRVFVNPVFAGSGINLKVGNPAERGIPVVTTPTGARGFTPGPGIVVADSAADYAATCIRLLTDRSAWQAASADAVERIAHYSPAAFLRASGMVGG